MASPPAQLLQSEPPLLPLGLGSATCPRLRPPRRRRFAAAPQHGRPSAPHPRSAWSAQVRGPHPLDEGGERRPDQAEPRLHLSVRLELMRGLHWQCTPMTGTTDLEGLPLQASKRAALRPGSGTHSQGQGKPVLSTCSILHRATTTRATRNHSSKGLSQNGYGVLGKPTETQRPCPDLRGTCIEVITVRL